MPAPRRGDRSPPSLAATSHSHSEMDHFGLETMRERERVGDSGGQLAVRSVPGEGTVVVVEAEWCCEESGDLEK